MIVLIEVWCEKKHPRVWFDPEIECPLCKVMVELTKARDRISQLEHGYDILRTALRKKETLK